MYNFFHKDLKDLQREPNNLLSGRVTIVLLLIY